MNAWAGHIWIDKLGYGAQPDVLHLPGEAVAEGHPYALEIRALLKPDGAIRARAVFEVEGVPTVVFVGEDGARLTASQLDEARKRIWNQNLASVVIEIQGDEAIARPVRKLRNADERLKLNEARPDGPFSASDVATSNLMRRVPKWFDARARVDRKLLSNMSLAVEDLAKEGFDAIDDEKERRRLAELLMGQVLFISYLEHRGIVGETYRETRGVGDLPSLVATADRQGLGALIDRLRKDFNGDFLGDDRHTPWRAMSDGGFDTLFKFLRRTDMRTGQGDFWNYDFSFIPVELLSGLYEKFLKPEDKAKEGAYYTPRNLSMLAVDQALLGSPDPLAETIFDGACGSGILLTTAYRRLLALREAVVGRQLGFAERGELLKSSIFGGDINEMACRVTAFSLYLSLLEGLDPADILLAQLQGQTTLPTLKGENIASGRDDADFFKRSHLFADKRFSLIISNPPWAEPEREARSAVDDWAAEAGVPFARRQIAGAYALRAQEFLQESGRVCLILPIGQLLGGSSTEFVAALLQAYRPTRLINFGDLQGLLFPTAENTCHVFLGERRAVQGPVAFDETFDYLVPKADLSLALGRLTMQSADRHQLQTRSVMDDPQLLVTMMWGDLRDLAIWTRLSLRGSFADFWRGPKAGRRWTNRKGIHLHDKSREAVDAGELRDGLFVPVKALSMGSPVLHPALLTAWPLHQRTVVGLNKDVLEVFKGPRVLFPDGFSSEEPNVRATYYDGPAAFTHSIGVISGEADDAALLKFVAVYLRSSLARYFLVIRAWKRLCERNGVHLEDVEAFPFFAPEQAPAPEKATAALASVSARMDELSAMEELDQKSAYEELRAELDEAVFDYFGLRGDERLLIRETVDLLLPSVRPRSFKRLDTPAQRLTTAGNIATYAGVLGESLTDWRRRTGGRGSFTVEVTASDPGRAGPSGIVRIAFTPDEDRDARVDSSMSDDLVLATLAQLRAAGLRSIPAGDFLALIPDTHLWIEGALYLVRPLTRRSWTRRQALRDAEQIVRDVQRRAGRQILAVAG